MDEFLEEEEIEREPRLIKTWLSKKPRAGSFIVVMVTFSIMSVISQIYWTNFFGLSQYLFASYETVFENYELWRLFTAIFIHADLEHFLSNMYMLVIFSYFIYGYSDVMTYPIMSFLLAAIVNAVSIYTYGPGIKLIGASGLVYLLAGTWFCFFFLIQRQYSIFKRTLRMIGIGLVILFPTTFSPTTSYRTHFIGLIFGILLGLIYFYKNKNKIRSIEYYK
ncbi:MAG: rhomboid family intramembrane serine protease [Bdellovibrionaceae bacterium]|jgi:rhomboid protease GluP|nr:rhomboid family intramembrane serine protease [Pseudobdellovibrionaceae bacterium]